MAKDFYELKQSKILKSFNKNFKYARKYLVERFDKPTADKIHDETIEQTKKLILQLPDVGDRKNQFISVVLLNAWYIAFYKVVKEHGVSAEEYVKMMTRVFYKTFEKYPKFIRHLAGKLIRSKVWIRRMKKHARISQEREYPKNWVYSVSTEMDNPDALFKVEYSQCTVCVIMNEFGVEELLPYCNVFDFIMAKSLGFGFENPQVLGRGHDTCIGIFRKDKKCEIPDYLEFAFEGLEL